MAAGGQPFTVARMSGILRLVGLLNAAIWLGGLVFFTFVSGRVPFAGETEVFLSRLGPEAGPYVGGMIAQFGVAHFFTFQMVCAIIALLHLGAEWLYIERRGRRFLLGLLAGLLLVTLAGDFWLRPMMNELFQVKHARNFPVEQRQAAARAFGVWHGAAMSVNVIVLGALVVYLRQMSRPPEPVRQVRALRFRG